MRITTYESTTAGDNEGEQCLIWNQSKQGSHETLCGNPSNGWSECRDPSRQTGRSDDIGRGGWDACYIIEGVESG